MFERLENFKNKEFISIINNKKISLEHIFPQNAGDDWYEDLDSQQYEFMQQKLHTLANLTLTGYNSELSNKGFIKKRELYKDSRLWLNSSLSSLSKWGKMSGKIDLLYYRNVFLIFGNNLNMKSKTQKLI
ncbi:HNH endonuclease family protein [Glaesserella parasuis]|uniref:HNH endonuclease family protein n=1 Tax=Glaesserella parasuis TaxID=738 RepID=UPI00243700F8|nr:HNH endonuclease family protein [Glaesserella parasuis]MDE3986391.1 HNH endonuclease family protein [Glaesserella parasuis]MDG6235199.1 HNH endonuclease family protein [Glaesserella parasuis]MDO9975296.1 HNH endonuclease family protein [Glaesserella parasuis]MDP0041140.1 HNH endonuclease family protein [Glaesserella parasuis]